MNRMSIILLTVLLTCLSSYSQDKTKTYRILIKEFTTSNNAAFPEIDKIDDLVVDQLKQNKSITVLKPNTAEFDFVLSGSVFYKTRNGRKYVFINGILTVDDRGKVKGITEEFEDTGSRETIYGKFAVKMAEFVDQYIKQLNSAAR